MSCLSILAKFGKVNSGYHCYASGWLMISIGRVAYNDGPNLAPLVITGGILEQIGWGVIGNLHILFA